MSLIGPEPSINAKHKQNFIDIGVLPVITDTDAVEACFDKFISNEKLKEVSLSSINSYLDKKLFYQELKDKKITFPVFVKPVKGSASVNVNIIYSKEELEILFERFDNLMIQKYLEGNEYGIDIYVDLFSNKTIAILTRKS